MSFYLQTEPDVNLEHEDNKPSKPLAACPHEASRGQIVPSRIQVALQTGVPPLQGHPAGAQLTRRTQTPPEGGFYLSGARASRYLCLCSIQRPGTHSWAGP